MPLVSWFCDLCDFSAFSLVPAGLPVTAFPNIKKEEEKRKEEKKKGKKRKKRRKKEF